MWTLHPVLLLHSSSSVVFNPEEQPQWLPAACEITYKLLSASITPMSSFPLHQISTVVTLMGCSPRNTCSAPILTSCFLSLVSPFLPFVWPQHFLGWTQTTALPWHKCLPHAPLQPSILHLPKSYHMNGLHLRFLHGLLSYFFLHCAWNLTFWDQVDCVQIPHMSYKPSDQIFLPYVSFSWPHSPNGDNNHDSLLGSLWGLKWYI